MRAGIVGDLQFPDPGPPGWIAGLLDSAGDAFVALDSEGRCTYANRPAEQLVGRPREELLGSGFWQALPDTAGSALARVCERAHAEGLPAELEAYLPTGRRWLDVRACPGEQGLVLFFRDITPRKRSEALLAGVKRVLERLAQGALPREVLGALVETVEAHSQEGLVASILLLDPDGVHLRHGAAPSLPDSFNRAIDGVAIGPSAGSCGTAAYRGEPVVVSDLATDPLWAEYRELALAHGLRACWSTPILSSVGKMLGTFVLYYPEPRLPGQQDLELIALVAGTAGLVIERARAEEERTRLYEAERRAREEAEAAVRARDEFLSIASHELRNPVAAIAGTAQLMRRALAHDRLDSERLARYIAAIERTSARLVTLTEDLLDVSRLQRGELPLRRRPTELAGLVRETVERQHARTSDHHFRVEVAREPCKGLFDPDRVEQILANLLDNAVKYSPDGGEILVRLAQDREGVLVRVRDGGIGLPPGAAERIFEPFGRAPNATERNIPGLGLGLYIGQQIAHQHGGRLWAESEGEGRGTTFSLWLPLGTTRTEEPTDA